MILFPYFYYFNCECFHNTRQRILKGLELLMMSLFHGITSIFPLINGLEVLVSVPSGMSIVIDIWKYKLILFFIFMWF